MPPRGHSGSSHSSSSRSSSSRSSSSRSSSSFRSSSSSRSSSSRSSSSFSRSSSRGPSSHSSSSRSSIPNFGSSRPLSSRSSTSRGPSGHSSSSRTSEPRPSYGNSYASKPRPQPKPINSTYKPPQPRRPRINQPLGYLIAGALAPRYLYGNNHDYVYYPSSWTDSNTGTHYESGYYDENGNRYDSVVTEQNGKYENVVCHCDYCDQDVLLNLDANTDALTDLKCPNCTAPLTIKSALDDYIQEESKSDVSYDNTGVGYTYSEPVKSKKKKKIWPWVVLIVISLGMYGKSLNATSPVNQYSNPPQITQTQVVESDPINFGDPIYLKKTGYKAYTYSSSGNADKTLVWDSDADSYYDETTDCWLWYNTDVEPSLWQYWFEDVSSNYESGWMEHDPDGWSIETAPGVWIDLPNRYNISKLWYIEG